MKNDSIITKASHQWMSRPDDQRFVSLIDMREHFDNVRAHSHENVLSSRRIEAAPDDDNTGLLLEWDGQQYAPTNYSFGQIAQLAEAPAGYLRSLPSPIAADCINYGLAFKRNIEDVGVLTYRNGGDPLLRAATGPRYGRIWNADVIRELVDRFGDGITGHFRVPGEFGEAVEVSKRNTTLYASDRDFFVFLADENNRIEIPNRRDGETGTLARGFFCWNSEVGDKTFGVATFLFDYVCCNRIVWGSREYKEITMRHTVSAPDKFLDAVQPALESYANSSTAGITRAIEDARAKKVGDVNEFLAKRFGRRVIEAIKTVHDIEEHKPIETLWDAATAVTAYARGIGHQDRRVEIEREAGKILALAE